MFKLSIVLLCVDKILHKLVYPIPENYGALRPLSVARFSPSTAEVSQRVSRVAARQEKQGFYFRRPDKHEERQARTSAI